MAAESNHTPGPWVWRGKSGSLHTVGRPPYAYGASVLEPTYDYDSGTDIAVSDADARLIAAAPEMLALLVHISESFPGYIPDFIEPVAKLLIKIEGRS